MNQPDHTSNRPHIVLVSSSYPIPDYEKGKAAAGEFVQDFAQSLCEHANVTVIAPGLQNREYDSKGVHVVVFRVPSLPLANIRLGSLQGMFQSFRSLASGARAMRRVIQSNPPDHILACWAVPSGIWARMWGNAPYDVWALGSDIWSLKASRAGRLMLRYVLRGAKRLYADGLALGDDVRRIANRQCGFMPSSRMLPEAAYGSETSGSKRRLAFLGRWHPNKGVDLLMNALRGLDDDDWQRIESVRIAGGGPLDETVRSISGQLIAAGRPVSVQGYLDSQEASELIAWADYLMLPSRIESVPVIFSDALQAGTPLIAMPVGDMPQFVARGSEVFVRHPASEQQKEPNTEVGILASAVSAESFREAIRHALTTDPDTYLSGIRQLAPWFDIARTARRYFDEIGLERARGAVL